MSRVATINFIGFQSVSLSTIFRQRVSSDDARASADSIEVFRSQMPPGHDFGPWNFFGAVRSRSEGVMLVLFGSAWDFVELGGIFRGSVGLVELCGACGTLWSLWNSMEPCGTR